MLVDLEVPQILRRRGIGRPAEESREAPTCRIVLLRVWSEPQHHHVVLHALA
jgi:hypothetical protein